MTRVHCHHTDHHYHYHCQGASTTCLRILPDAETSPISSGVENGVELLLDLETFDNGEFGVDEDALKILVADQHDHPLLDLNGFTVKPDDLVIQWDLT